MATGTTQYNGYKVYVGVSWNYDKKSLAVKMYPSRQYPQKKKWGAHEKVWKNYCPGCKKSGVLRAIGSKGRKTALEGEVNCTGCDMDFDGVQGYEKINGSKMHITEASSSSDASTTKKLTDIKKNKETVLKDLKKEYDENKYPKTNMTLKIPPIDNIMDGYCHQLSPPLVSKDTIVYVESVEISEKEIIMQLNDKLEAPGEEYKPPSGNSNKSTASNYKATTVAEKEIIARGENLKASTGLQTVKNIEQWIRKNIKYVGYFNWSGGSGDPTKLDKTTLAKRWNSKSGNCVFASWLFYVMAQGAGVTVEIWNGTAVFGSGKTIGHLWNKYQGKPYDGSSSSSRNFKGRKVK